ncbi:MAG: hypothetical protein HW378_183 [Anaerolineales bacterium]|nr:hypothetical protein [Anaerolineales bacterium]
MAASFLAHSQSATNLTLRCIISLDDGSRATNIVNISGTRLAGLIEGWKLDTTNKVNAKAPALTLGQYVFQEVKDKGAEWERAGALNELKAAGFTNTAVTPSQKLLDKWATLTPTQQSRVVEYLNSVAE